MHERCYPEHIKHTFLIALAEITCHFLHGSTFQVGIIICFMVGRLGDILGRLWGDNGVFS